MIVVIDDLTLWIVLFVVGAGTMAALPTALALRVAQDTRAHAPRAIRPPAGTRAHCEVNAAGGRARLWTVKPRGGRVVE